MAEEPTRLFQSRAARRKTLRRALAVAGALLVATAAGLAVAPRATDPTWLRAQIAAFGPLAPIAFVGLQALQVLVAPIPGQLLGGVAGYLFGAGPGALYSMLGVLIGSGVVFVLARRYGRPYLESVLRPRTLARWDRFVERNGAPGLFVLFLLPTFPDDLLCFVAGVSEIRLDTFLALVLVGRAPSFLAVAYAGTRLADGALWTTTLVVTALVVLSTVVLRERSRILDAFDRSA